MIFWIPAIASVVGLVVLGNRLRHPFIFLMWFMIALVVQLSATRLSDAWTLALLAQTALAVIVFAPFARHDETAPVIEDALSTPTHHDDPVEVFAGSFQEADLLRSMLEGQSIASFLNNEVLGRVMPWYTGPAGVGSVRVLVAAEDLRRAQPIVKVFLNQFGTTRSAPE